ncbi:MAG: lysylphosphatidylglycerol synthase domain-containing protein [Gaiellales bacterium]
MSVTQVAQLLDSAVDRVAELDARFLAVALVLQLVAIGAKVTAWRNILAAAFPESSVRWHKVACSYTAGMGLNAFLPARGGDAVKVALLRTQIAGSEVPAIVTTHGVVSAFDVIIGAVLVVTLWLTGSLPALTIPQPTASIPLVAAAVAAVALLLLLIRARRPDLLRSTMTKALHGVAILRQPRRYALTVAPFQLAAWACRVAVVYLVLLAFGIEAGIVTAALIVVLGGVSAAVPVPGGAGTQQVLATYALNGIASAATAISFSVGLQIGVTVVNTMAGILGAMLLFRTGRPLSAVRAVIGDSRARRS